MVLWSITPQAANGICLRRHLPDDLLSHGIACCRRTCTQHRSVQRRHQHACLNLKLLQSQAGCSLSRDASLQHLGKALEVRQGAWNPDDGFQQSWSSILRWAGWRNHLRRLFRTIGDQRNRGQIRKIPSAGYSQVGCAARHHSYPKNDKKGTSGRKHLSVWLWSYLWRNASHRCSESESQI